METKKNLLPVCFLLPALILLLLFGGQIESGGFLIFSLRTDGQFDRQ